MSNLVTLYVTEFPKALRLLYPTLNTSQITIGYQKATGVNTKFIVWGFQNIAQQVFTGGREARGIDQPTFNINIYARQMVDAAQLADVIVDTWNGESIMFTPLLSVAKSTVKVLTSAYDEEDSFHRIEIDLELTVNVLL